LVTGAQLGACDGFDTHVVASVVSLGLMESAQQGLPPSDALGLLPAELVELAALAFPHAVALFTRLATDATCEPSADERCLRELLFRGSTEGSRLEFLLAALVARRALRPNHLWQDLGLRHRRELSWLMSRHFEPIAAHNKQDMKWKKFLYRMICRDEGFALCVAPSCSECDDFPKCFGDEAGDALLAETPAAACRESCPVAKATNVEQSTSDTTD
jgi:nitrogen fixation protein NifQ